MRILCLPYTHILSHVSRTLLIARELRTRGHEVIFAGESTKTQFIKNDGFEVLPLHEMSPQLLLSNIRKGKIKFVENDELEMMVQQDIDLYKQAQPDIVLSDFRFSAPISTFAADIKHVAIVNASSTEYRANPFIPLFEWIPVSAYTTPSIWSLLNRLNISIEMMVFDTVMNSFAKLSRKYGLTKQVTATNCLTGKDITLLADVPEYFPTTNLPSNYHYIGPLVWENSAGMPNWWPPPTSRPLIYITMGTTGFQKFFEQVYLLFQDCDFTIIITTGGQITGLNTIDGSIYVTDFLDGNAVMERCSLVVCHGGNGTINQALLHGVPIIGIPTIPDQKFNMRRVQDLGLGKMLQWEVFSKNPLSLIDMIHAVINDMSIKQNTKIFREKLKGFSAVQTAADIICSP